MGQPRGFSPFIPPESVDECDNRVAELRANLTMIVADLSDQGRRESMEASEYGAWRSRARRAQAHLKYELDMLRAWRARRQQETAEAKKEARARNTLHDQEKRDRFDQVLTEHGLESDLVLRLYIALARLCRKEGIAVDDSTRVALDRARIYLIDIGVFE